MQDKDLGKVVETNKMAAALAQIHGAIFMFKKEELECAITLGAAAEGVVQATDHPHIHSVIMSSTVSKEVDFNETINWLKHPTDPDDNLISEFDAVIVIVRAINKFDSVYKTGSPAMRDFVRMAFDRGFMPWPYEESTSS